MTDDAKSQTILITGGCGFVGANLAKYLLKNSDHNIRILDNLSAGNTNYIEEIASRFGDSKLILPTQNSDLKTKDQRLKTKDPISKTENLKLRAQDQRNVTVIEGDIQNKEDVDKITNDIDAIVHLAAITGVPDSIDDPVSTYEVNVIGTQNLLEACREKTIEKFVFASSNAAVGEKEPPIHEEMVPEPISPYGASKLAGEGLCSAYSHSFGIKANALRFANVYGPFSDHKSSVVAKFIRNGLNGKPLIIYGDGNQTRDFIHAVDIAKAIKLTLESECAGEVFQIGTGEETKILELAHMIQKLANENDYKSPEIIHKKPRRGDIYRNYADLSKAQKILGFKPEVHIKEGLRQVWELGMCVI